ncbi:uncharacterized protein LOC144371338 [Ictidomys tridecemlineatus]
MEGAAPGIRDRRRIYSIEYRMLFLLTALRKWEREQVGDIFQVEALPEEEVIKLAKKPFCEAPVASRLLRKNSCVETNSSWAFAFDMRRESEPLISCRFLALPMG